MDHAHEARILRLNDLEMVVGRGRILLENRADLRIVDFLSQGPQMLGQGFLFCHRQFHCFALVEVSSFDFYAGKHELIYNAIVNLFGKGEPTDVIAVTDELNKQGNLLKAGGSDYLHSLASYVPTAAAAGYYASIVAEKAILRRLIEAGTRIAQSGYESQGEVVDLVNQAQADLYKVASQSSKEDYVGLSESLEAAIHEIEVAQNRGGELTGTPTGFTDLDAYTHGLHPGQLVIVAARPAVGKSTFALDIARNASVKHNQATIFFSLEMGRAEIAMRMLSAESSIYLQSMIKSL